MNRMGLRGAIRVLWTAAAVSLIGVLISGAADGVRLELLTVLALFSAPSSFAAAPLVNWLVGQLDMDNIRLIDLFVSVTMTLFGYVQWFVLPALVIRAKRRAESRDL